MVECRFIMAVLLSAETCKQHHQYTEEDAGTRSDAGRPWELIQALADVDRQLAFEERALRHVRLEADAGEPARADPARRRRLLAFERRWAADEGVALEIDALAIDVDAGERVRMKR